MPPQRKTPINYAHIIALGLKICEGDTCTKVVVSVTCLFCVHFGREDKVGAKRKATSNIQSFKHLFRAYFYQKHMKTHHPQNWETYYALSNEQKATFFDESAPVVHRNTIWSHFDGAPAHMYHFVNKSIVDVIVGEILFHPDDAKMR